MGGQRGRASAPAAVLGAAMWLDWRFGLHPDEGPDVFHVKEKLGGVSCDFLFNPECSNAGPPPHRFLGLSQVWAPGAGRVGARVGSRAPRPTPRPSARAGREIGGAAPAPRPLPPRASPFLAATRPLSPPLGPRRPVGGGGRPGRAQRRALICCGSRGSTAPAGAFQRGGREKCSAPKARSALPVPAAGSGPHSSGARTGSGSRGGGGQGRRAGVGGVGGGEGERAERGPGRPAGQGRAVPPVGERARRPVPGSRRHKGNEPRLLPMPS